MRIDMIKDDPAGWMNHIAFLKDEIVHQRRGTAQQKIALERARIMVAFGLSCAEECKPETDEKTGKLAALKPDRFCAFRDAMFGIQGLYMDHPLHLELFAASLHPNFRSSSSSSSDTTTAAEPTTTTTTPDKVFVTLENCLIHSFASESIAGVSMPAGISEDHWRKQQILHDYLSAWTQVVMIPSHLLPGSYCIIQEEEEEEEKYRVLVGDVIDRFRANSWFQQNSDWLVDQLPPPRFGWYGYEQDERTGTKQLTVTTVKAILQNLVRNWFNLKVRGWSDRRSKQSFFIIDLKPFYLLRNLAFRYGI